MSNDFNQILQGILQLSRRIKESEFCKNFEVLRRSLGDAEFHKDLGRFSRALRESELCKNFENLSRGLKESELHWDFEKLPKHNIPSVSEMLARQAESDYLRRRNKIDIQVNVELNREGGDKSSEG